MAKFERAQMLPEKIGWSMTQAGVSMWPMRDAVLIALDRADDLTTMLGISMGELTEMLVVTLHHGGSGGGDA